MTGVGLSAISYALASTSRTVRELHASGALDSNPDILERFGFEAVRVAESECPYELARGAATELLRDNDIDPLSIGALIYGGAPSALAFATPARSTSSAVELCGTGRFQYPGTRLQYDLGLQHASVIGLDQLACTTLFAAIRLARALCSSEHMDRVLCVSSEFYPSAAGREAITNCTSDAACAVLVERGCERNRVLGATTITKGFYWNPEQMKDEVMASYFPTALEVLRQTRCAAGWQPGDVQWIVPHNVSRTSWDILLRLAALPNARLWDDNIRRIGHTLAGDNFINLCDATAAGVIGRGERVLMFSYGYGAHWTALALET